MRFYTTERLGQKRLVTPEGYLLCEAVPIARTGKMQYAPGEIPKAITPGPDGTVWIEREPDEVFKPESIASFAGKAVVNDHPPLGIKVTPENHNVYSIGTVLNPRRGDGIQLDNDFLYADLLITNADAIKEINDDDKRQVSAGYDAEYDETGPGRGRQRDIIGNHVAIVDRGRCGPRCAIGDSEMAAKNPFNAFRDRVMKMVKAGDADGVGEELKKIPEMLGDIVSDEAPDADGGKGHVTVHVHGSTPAGTVTGNDRRRMRDADETESTAGDDSRVQALEDRVEALEQVIMLLIEDDDDDEGDGTGDRRMRDRGRARDTAGNERTERDPEPGSEEHNLSGDRRRTRDDAADGDDQEEREADRTSRATTGDSAHHATVGDSTSLRTAFQSLATRAEILLPGVQLPTYDAKAAARVTVDSMCQFRRQVLTSAVRTPEGKAAVEAVMPGKPLMFTDKAMDCSMITTVFDAASALRGAMNNNGVRPSTASRGIIGNGISKVPTAADINAANRKAYGPKVNA